MYTVKCLNPIASKGLDLFTEDFKVIDDLDKADAVLVRSAAMHDLEVPESLLAVARAGAGVNNIPLDEYAKKGIVAFNTPGANANGVKELVVAGLLLASRDIIGGYNWVKENASEENLAKLVEKQKKQYAGNELKGKSIGVIGLGAIGVLVANICNRLGMKVYGYDPYVSVRSAWSLSRMVKHIASIDELFETCDYITIHVPYMDSTKGMINKEAIDKMKDGVTLLNFARGELVDNQAVIEGLASGKVKHYVTDFPSAEIAGVDKVITIPHLGASTEESEENCAEMAVDQLMNYLENGNIVNSVNYPNCDLGEASGAARITVHHKNLPNMIGQLTAILAADGHNISNMLNKSKGEWAYSMFDMEKKAPTEETIKKMEQIDGVFVFVYYRREKMSEKLRVGILGATGMVGQRFISLLENHPWFEVTTLAASPRSAGKTYEEAVGGRWKMDTPMPEAVKSMIVKNVNEVEEVASHVDFVFSAVDMSKDEIKKIEEDYAKTETPVVSNNSAHRWTPDVPMVVPEINPEHFEVIESQKKRLGTTKGFIAVKPNCSIQSYAPVLTAWKEFEPYEVVATTYQAISGAGKTFKDWPEMEGNIIPYIGGEEEKSEQEPLRLWGHIENGVIVKAETPVITTQCIRVPVLNGHTAAVFVKFKKKPTKEQLIEKLVNFSGLPQELELPSAPKQMIQYLEEDNRPQVREDVDYENGMGISVGRLREDTVYDYKFVGLSHNTVRGAAGGAVLCAETLKAKGYITKK